MTTVADQDRRRASDALLALVQTIHADVQVVRSDIQQVRAEVRGLDTKLSDHLTAGPGEWADAMNELIGKAFPAGDPDGHREAHEAQMQAIRDKAQFWKDLAFEVSKWGLLGLIGWLAFHAWVAFIKGPA